MSCDLLRITQKTEVLKILAFMFLCTVTIEVCTDFKVTRPFLLSHLGLWVTVLSPSGSGPRGEEKHTRCTQNPVAVWILDTSKKQNGSREGEGEADVLRRDCRKWVPDQGAAISVNISALFHSNTQCSATCGKGTRMRYVSCRDEDGSVADESACAALPRPVAKEECSVPPCGQWKVLDWSPVSEWTL